MQAGGRVLALEAACRFCRPVLRIGGGAAPENLAVFVHAINHGFGNGCDDARVVARQSSRAIEVFRDRLPDALLHTVCP